MSPSEATNDIELSLQDQRLLFTQLHLMLDAGVPLMRALEALERSPGGAGRVSEALGDRLHRGTELEVAFARSSKNFETLTLGLLKLGRRTGSLVEVLKRLASRAEERCRRQEQLHSSLAYPCGVLSVATLCCLALAWVLLPQLAAVLQSLGSEPPLPTRILLTFASYRAVFFNLLALPLLVLAFLHRFRREKLRLWLTSLIPHIPMLGPLKQTERRAELAQDLSLALHAGLPVADSFILLAESTSDSDLRASLIRVGKGLSLGEELERCLRDEPSLGVLLRQSLVVGLESGDMVPILEAAAQTIEEELDYRTNRLVSLLEPTVMLILGLVTGFVVLASLLPIYRMSTLS